MRKEIIFETKEDFREWLKDNCRISGGIWLILGKTDELKTVSAAEALEEALCFGWIDSTIVSIDEHKYRKYFSLRRKNSIWSEKNKGLVQKLIKERRMTEHGLMAVEQAKESGEWYKERNRDISEARKTEFENLIRGNDTAYRNFLSSAPSYKKQYMGYYYEAKSEETRKKRLDKIIDRLEQKKGLM